MEWKLEVIVLPVADLERAKRFYAEQVGFNVDVDRQITEQFRVVQLTPPGSGCSVSLVSGYSEMQPGTLKGLQLTVPDVRLARDQLVDRGVEVSPVRYMDNGQWRDGHRGPWESFIFFNDPDGNGWAVQERPTS
jgi:catechol 2,3-dioxygenase-like lactoylglutathione lyase family enzyme